MKISDYAMRASDGSVDVNATVEKFATELQSYLDNAEREGVEIQVAVSAIFDTHHGKAISMPALTSLACSMLNVTPESFVDTSEKVADYVRSHKGEYLVSKGKGGGVRRVCDIPPKESK